VKRNRGSHRACSGSRRSSWQAYPPALAGDSLAIRRTRAMIRFMPLAAFRTVGARRVTRAMLALVLVVIGTGVVTVACASVRLSATGTPNAGEAPAGPTRIYRDPSGWSISYPRAYHLESSEKELHLAAVETTVATFMPQSGIDAERYASGATVRVVPPLDAKSRFPADAAALRVVYQSGLPTLGVRARTPYVRLSVASLRASIGPRGQSYDAATGATYHANEYHGAPQAIARSVSVHGNIYAVVAWIGSRASERDRATLARMVASLTFG
jgi:hypothetical protein